MGLICGLGLCGRIHVDSTAMGRPRILQTTPSRRWPRWIGDQGRSAGLRRKESRTQERDPESIPWLNQKLLKFEADALFARECWRSRSELERGRLAGGECAFLCFRLCGFAGRQFLFAFAGAGDSDGRPAVLAGWLFKRKRRFAQFEKGLPEALDLMVSGCAPGTVCLRPWRWWRASARRRWAANSRFVLRAELRAADERSAGESARPVPLQDLKITATAIMIQKRREGPIWPSAGQGGVCESASRLPVEAPDYGAPRPQGRLTGWN